MTSRAPTTIASAQLAWDDNGQPLSAQFDDVYFSKQDGLQETEYVFLNQNRLAERWQGLQPGQRFTVAETGFGTGLNFLAGWALWRKTAPADSRLHFVSVEKFPMTASDLEKALALWPTLGELSQQLVSAYPPAVAGFHRLEFDHGRVCLTLMFCEAAEGFAQLHGQVDAWFLDGFAPAKNPQMWSESLFAQIARLSQPQTTFSTFTAAGIVRRGLQAVGFAVEKVPGFGRKREMLRGTFSADLPTTVALAQSQTKPWFQLPKPLPARKAIVVGAGLAGCSAAHALARRGWQVTLVDRHDQIAGGASGNPQGALYIKPATEQSAASRLHIAGLTYSLRRLQQLLADRCDEAWSPCGVLQLAYNDREVQRQTRVLDNPLYPRSLLQAVDADTARALSGVDLATGGLLLPEAGWVDPAALCRTLAATPGITLDLGREISQIHYDRQQQGWQLQDAKGDLLQQAPVLILACADQASRFQAAEHLPLKAIRGQISLMRQPATDPGLKLVVCAEGYASPPRDGQYCFGASFNLHEHTPQERATDHEHNLQLLRSLHPTLAASHGKETGTLRGRVGFRCATPDYLPLVGALPDREAFIDTFGTLRHNANAQIDAPPRHLPGLFVSLGHGSKGLVTAPLCGELLAAQIVGDPLPLEKNLVDALNPARFLVKDLVRRTI